MAASIAALRTLRTELRPLTAADLDAAHALWTDPDVRRHLWDDVVIPRASAPPKRSRPARATSRRTASACGASTTRVGGPLVGFCGGQPADGGEPELLYGLLRPWWGQGLATECAGAVLDHLFGPLGSAEVVGSDRRAQPRRRCA